MDVTVVGLGLIGGSLLRALAGAGHRVTGYDADPATRESARELGHRPAGDARSEVADDRGGFAVAGSVREAAEGAELVVLAVPLPALPPVLAELRTDVLVTDVTSVKGPVRDLAAKHGFGRFVGGHPMAGKETSGFAAADPRLFDGCAWVLCLEPGAIEPGAIEPGAAEPGAAGGTDLGDWLTLAELYTAMGARVVPITADEHDRAVAQVSHVPHLFAAALAGQLAGNPPAGTLAAGSFRDGTRVAATRAELIVAMCGGNAAAVDHALRGLIGDLEAMREALAADPVGLLTPVVAAAGDLRRGWPAASGPAYDLPVSAEGLLALGRAGGWITGVAENRTHVRALRPETDRNSA